MRKFSSFNVSCTVVFFILFSAAVFGQTAHHPQTHRASPVKGKLIQATAMGTSTQLGRNFTVNIHVYDLSTPAEQKGLIESFAAKGNEGLVNALSKMESKGRLSMPATIGYDVAYIREIRNKDGSFVVRGVTDRPIAIGELWYNGRSRDYNLSAFEITFKRDKKGKWKGTGTLMPAAEFKIGKDNQLTIELLQNPWTLQNIAIR